MRDVRRAGLAVAAGVVMLGAALGAPLAGQETVVEERLEIVEVGVLADLPASLRGKTTRELAERVTIVEGGVERRPSGVAALGGEGTDPYGRVLVVVDLERCSPEILRLAPAALGGQAEKLTALGPVEVALLDGRLERIAGPSRSADEIAAALAGVAADRRCGAPPPPDRLETIELAADALACTARPCLLTWIGPGWGQAPDPSGGTAPPPSPDSVDPLARRLAGRGWAVLAAPIDDDGSKTPERHAPEPRYDAASGKYTFGINVLQRKREKPAPTAEEYSKFVDLWLAPLRRLVASTVGEFVVASDKLPAALDALAGRSILYYRTERAPSGEAPTLVVRQPGTDGREYKAPRWAPLFLK